MRRAFYTRTTAMGMLMISMLPLLCFSSIPPPNMPLPNHQESMYTLYDVEKKYVIGVPLKTSNEHFVKEVPPMRESFYKENTAAKIPNKTGSDLLAVYTDYEGDYTKPFVYIIGCEVANLDKIPKGMVGIEIPARSYALFKTNGPFPQALAETWREIWQSDLKRSYTTDFEVYPADFHPVNKSEVEVYIAVDN